MATLAEQLADYVCRLEYKDLPADVIVKAKECVLDQLGCQVIASTLSFNKIIYDFVIASRGREECTIVNSGTRVSAIEAAFINGTFGQGAELDDVLEYGGCHPGAASVPVAIALGEKEHVDGKTFLTSVVAGYDMSHRLGRGMMPHVANRGFHPQNILGNFCAAAIAGKILKLNPKQMANAFGIAGSYCSGTMEYDQGGGEVKRMHNGLAVRGGMEAAALAKIGLTGPFTILEGKRGIMPLYAGQYDVKVVTENLWQDFGVAHVYFKRYSTVGNVQCPIDVFAQLAKEHGFKAKDITRIDVGVSPRFVAHGGSIREPQDTIGAQMSLGYCLAIRLLKGNNDLPMYTNPALWRDPEVTELSRKVHPYANPEAEGQIRYSAKVRVTLSSGKTVEGHQLYPKGMPQNPLTMEELKEKFRGLAGAVFPSQRVERIIRVVDELEQSKDVAELVSLLGKND